MMKRIILLLAAALLLCFGGTALAADKLEFYNAETGDYEVRKTCSVDYTVLSDTQVRLDDIYPYNADEATGSTFTVQLPSRINGFDVVAINGARAFSIYSNIDVHLIIPPEVTLIHNDDGSGLGNAVLFSRRVTSVEILGETSPFSITEDGQFFHGTTLVGCLGAGERTEVSVAAGTTAVELCAFSSFEKLTVITLPHSVTEVHYAPLPERLTTAPRTLQRINVERGNPALLSVSGVLYAGDRLVCCPPSAQLQKLALPAGIREIGSYALVYCDHLTEVLLPESLEIIRRGAFRNVARLESLHLPAGLHTIEEGAFNSNYWLNQVTLAPENPNFRIESQLLIDNASDTALLAYGVEGTHCTVPDGVHALGDYSFTSRPWLTHVTLPEGLESIGTEAFSWTGLQSVSLPSTLKEMGDGVFSFCDVLKEVVFPQNATSLTSIPAKTFYFCEQLREFIPPEQNSITSIGDSAFAYCSQLQKLTFPQGLTEIGEEALWCCSRLQTLILPATLREFDISSVFDCHQLKTVLVMGKDTRLKGYASSLSATFVIQRDHSTSLSNVDIDTELYERWVFYRGPMRVSECSDAALQQLLDEGAEMLCTFNESYVERSFTASDGKKYSLGRENTSTLQIALTTADGQTVTREYPCILGNGQLRMGSNHLAFTILDPTTVRVESAQWTMTLKGEDLP